MFLYPEHKLRFLTIFDFVTIELDVFTQSLRIHPNELSGMDWTTRLSEPVVLDNGEVLRTLSDAREFILALPEQHRAFAKWQRVASLLSVAAKFDRADLIATATVELWKALRTPPLAPVRLIDVTPPKKPTAPSVKRRRKLLE